MIEQYARPERLSISRLEGSFSSLRIQKNPDSVLITDIEAVPLGFKQATLSAYFWEALPNRLGVGEQKEWEGRIQKLEFKPDKKAIATELKRGNEIQGADLKFGEWRLVIS